MIPSSTNETLAVRFRAIAVIAVTIVVLLGGLVHHHANESDESACSYCHAGVQAPVPDLARTLSAPCFAQVADVVPDPISRSVSAQSFSSLIPRAPPSVNSTNLF